MEKIKINFLGTGSMIPTAKRSHTAILLTYKNENILIDCGEGTQRQFKIAEISPSKLTRILLTHWHGDHILGLPGLFQTLGMNDYKKTLQIYGPRKTKEHLELIKKLINISISLAVHEISSGKFVFGAQKIAKQFSKDFELSRQFAPKTNISGILKIFETNDFVIQASPMSHGIPTLAFSFQIKDKLRLDKSKLKKLKIPDGPHMKQLQQGKSIKLEGKTIKPSQVAYEEKGKKVTFILDTSINENAVKLAKDSDVLICESSFTEKETEMAKERFHLTAKQAATIAKEAKVKELILTHLSQRYEHNVSPILDEARKVFKNTKIAKDFDKIEI